MTDADTEALSRPFVQGLLMLMRSHDRSGVWDAISDAEVVEPFIVTKAQKREIPLIGEPDPDILWRVELYYQAVAWQIEKRTGHATQPVMRIHHEGWGRVVLIAGKLVALDAHVRELHRFGFDSIAQLEEKGLKLVEAGVATTQKFPDVAAA
ncbi:MAG: NifX-associated nitrogen fixation protein [Actinomycetota bacterium]